MNEAKLIMELQDTYKRLQGGAWPSSESDVRIALGFLLKCELERQVKNP